jgi:copper oxidase (laccase) domain-containing protein
VTAASTHLVLACGAGVAHIRCSTVRDGDFHLDSAPVALAHRQQAFAPGVWTHLDEVHGTCVRVVTRPGEFDRSEGDAAVTRVPGAVLSVWVGDCAPVVLVGDDGGDERRGGVVAVAHAGWRGALDGVVQATVAAMRARRVHAVLGPCIGPCCYEFGDDLLEEFVHRYGPSVASTTSWGTPSLSMPEVVRVALAECDVPARRMGACTQCDRRWFSHRRGDTGRHVMTVTSMSAA